MEIQFEDLDKSDFFIDCVYKGGKAPNMSSEPFHKLILGCENAGGFRKKLREDGSGKYAYIVLYTSMEELEWPDYLDEETGIFRYYGDNREPGRELTDTKKKGNKILEMAFSLLNEGKNLDDIIAESPESGVSIVMARNGREFFVTGHNRGKFLY